MADDKFFYKTITQTRVTVLNRKATTIIVDKTEGNTELDFILSCYTPANALAGYTDYVDHRKDTLPQIKN